MATSSSFTSVVALHSRQSRLCFYRRVIVLSFFSSTVSALWHQVERSASRLVTVCNFEMWCMTGYWENANWKSIFLKPRATTVPRVERQAELSRRKKNSVYTRTWTPPTRRMPRVCFCVLAFRHSVKNWRQRINRELVLDFLYSFFIFPIKNTRYQSIRYIIYFNRVVRSAGSFVFTFFGKRNTIERLLFAPLYILTWRLDLVKKEENERFSIEHVRCSIFLGQSIKG